MTETTNDVIEKIDVLNARARELQNNPEPEGQQVAEEALALAEKEQHKKGIAEALCTLGVRNYLKGNFILMLEQSERSLAIQEEIGDKRGSANSLNNLGIAYHSTGDYSKALEYFMRPLAIQEELGDKRGIANSLNNISNVYYSTGDYSKSLEYLMRALAIQEKIGAKRGIANSLANIGKVYSSTGDYSKSLEYQMRALAIFEEISGKDGITLSIINIGNVYFRTANYSEALEYHLRSLSINEETGNKQGIAISLNNIGEIYATQNYDGHNTAKASEYFLQALALFEEIKAKKSVFEVHKALAEVYEQSGNTGKSLEHFKKFYETEKEVYSEETTKKIQNLETQQKFIEIEKEREIERREQKATFKILNRVLPRQIVDRVKAGEENIADKFPSASVLFADIVGFTPLAEKLGADEVLKLLSGIFSHFDLLCEKFGVEKIKTVGDSYMSASGVPVASDDHLFKIARLALAMQEDIKLNLDFKIPELSIRIGVHTGEVIAGVLGTQKLSYDIWGDTVNTAARMESHGEADMIHTTEEVFKALKDGFDFEERGEIEIKGKGKMQTYFLIGEK